MDVQCKIIALNNEITTQYDDIDRVLRVTDARGNYVDMTYELGLLTEINSPDNEGSATNRRRVRMPRTTHYDFAGRLLQVDAEKSTNTFETRVEYLYTGFSQIRSLLRLKDAVTKSTDYSYDRLGRLLNVNDFKGDDTDLEHAPFCSNSTVKTPRGIHRKSVFDGLCRMTQVETQEERHLFDYDELDRLIRATVGERYAHTPPGQSRQGGRYAKTVLKFNTDYVYDENDRVTHIHYPNGDTVAYTYDDEGNVLSVTDVHGKTTSYTYYRDGRLKTVSYAGQTFSYSYDAAGRLSQIDYPSSTNVVASFTKTDTTTGWDPNGQLLSVRYLKSGTEFQRFVYSYDNSGNRKTMDEVRTLSGTPVTVNWAYTYDGFNRLAQVYKNSNLVSVYTYDESDNRTQVDWPQSGEVWKMTFDIADRIEKREYKVGAGAFSDFETYTHDDDGNMTSRTLVASSTTVSYDWNSHNRLRQVRENGAHKESTSFDHGGIRRLKADSGGNTKYFSSAGMSLADTRPSGEVSFLQGHQLLGLEESGNLYYFVTDGLSSVRLVLDSSGNIQGELRYNEWGVPEAAVSPLSAPAAGLSGHSYTGGLGVRNDGASLGLYYARQRFFDPSLARWLTPDPIGFSGGLNLYTAMENSPTGTVDAEGLIPGPGAGGDEVILMRSAKPKRAKVRAACPRRLQFQVDKDRLFVFGATPNIPGGRLMRNLGFRHQWLVTAESRAGMGNKVGIPGENGQTSPDLPFSPTYVRSHDGRQPETWHQVSGVDLRALNTWMKEGRPTGPWTPLVNDCNTYVGQSIRESTPHDVRIQDLSRSLPGHRELPLVLPSRLPHLNNVVRYSDGTYHPPGALSR